MSNLTKNTKLNAWLDEMIALTNPANVVLIDGTDEQAEALRAEACASGELFKLNQEKLPGCYLHRTAVNDVARVENRTFICTTKKEDAGPTNNWMSPKECYDKLTPLFRNSYAGKTMYVIPYSMGVVGSPFAKNGIELTDSIYVVLNMLIMTRVGTDVLDAMGTDGDFIKGLHARATMDENNRYICHFPEDNTIWSVNSGYGGNVLLGKKCFALRIASYLGRNEGWMAEHMLILGIENPEGEIKYIAAAFPSACGKTNLAMLVPPASYREAGWKTSIIGDDIAWIWPHEDGTFHAINPENGYFGVAPGTSYKTNPIAMDTIKENVIFTNVGLTDDGDVWWEGMDGPAPAHAIDWQGNDWTPDCGRKCAHPNARFTAPASQCPTIDPEWQNPEGVSLSAILFGGRRATTMPLVFQSRDWTHGVYVGATMGSEMTAAAFGNIGQVRRDPMAMLPFIGYHVGDYWQHWLDMGKTVANPPLIFNVNWFRKDKDGNFIWPGYGDNMRVLDWILRRAKGKAEGQKTVLGVSPTYAELDKTGLDYSEEQFNANMALNPSEWQAELESQTELFDKVGKKLPAELEEQRQLLIKSFS
mgnify:CR=1 FL=1